MSRKRRLAIAAVLFVLGMPWTAHAQRRIASLGKGWLLGPLGSITSAPGEVISGSNSIKGSGSSNSFLLTDPAIIKFAANQTYTITVNYRILTSSAGVLFGYGFSSSTGVGTAGDFGPDAPPITGAPGSSGTVTAALTVHNWPDYQVRFYIADASASIAIDDVKVTDANGHLVASENAEGPAFVPGPLNFQLTDAIASLTPGTAMVDGVGVRDLNGDGYAETILTLQYAPTTTDLFQPIVVEASGRLRIATTDIFPTGIPTTMNSPMVLFPDVNGDGLPDIVLSDAGLDVPPFTGRRLGVALNNGNGTYRDVSPLIPADQWTNRAYASPVGDVYGDGKMEIILPDEVDGSNPVLLRWNGNGFDEIRNWIPASIWKDGPALLHAQSWMNLADFDLDGHLDLLVAGQDHNPNFQIVFGDAGGFTAGTLVVLPDGPFGHYTPPPADGTLTTQELDPVIVADFDNDGRPDIFATLIKKTVNADLSYLIGESTYNVRLNKGSRTFVDASPTPYTNLGLVAYQNLFAIDINNDGFLDVVGTYTGPYNSSYSNSGFYGTTFFLNDGTGAFQVVDGANLLGVTTTPSDGHVRNLGSFVPTIVTPLRMEGIVWESVGGCGVPSACNAANLNIYKVVANGALGTGPNFVDPATLGVPGFNEFYYLRHYPDAAAAVQAGQYSSGLAHYLAVGAGLGYQAHAASGISPLPAVSSVAGIVTRKRTPLTVSFTVSDLVGGAAGVTVAAISSNPAVVPNANMVAGGSGANRTLTITPGQVGTTTITLFANARGLTSSTSFVLAVSAPSSGDFDGDGKAEISVFRPSNGTWYIRYTGTPTTDAFVWGGGADIPVPGDFDGDGKTDIAIFRPSTGTWYIRYTATPTSAALVWGGAGDIPVAADFDGDGKTDIAIFRPSTGTWYIRYTATPTSAALVWGGGGDVPVPADFDGDGKAEIAVFRPSTGTWYVRYTATPTSAALVWGGGGDVPVPVDFDGDGKAEIAVFRPSTGTWYIRYTATPTSAALVWGGGGDVPVAGDFDGDGKTEIAVFRPSTGTWYIRYTATPTSAALVWGGAGDAPILKGP